jgi:hypothetical protein
MMSTISWQINRSIAKHEMMEKLEQQNLQTVRIDYLQWYEEGKELIIDGQLFDVKKVTRSDNGKYLVTGLFDVKEKALYEKLEDITRNSSKNQILSQLFQLCWNVDNNSSIESVLFKISIVHTVFNTTCADVFRKDILSPPPQVCFA